MLGSTELQAQPAEQPSTHPASQVEARDHTEKDREADTDTDTDTDTEADTEADSPKKRLSPEALANRARESVVMISASNRQGRMQGSGTGFVVRKDGWIASNFHVIGQHRPFMIRFADGKRYEPKEIIAVDRKRDLALIRIDPKHPLTALRLADSDEVKPGQAILTLGNPLGLAFSVGKGVVAATDREVGEQSMIQVAVPLEPGSSGSPVLNMKGEVLGVLGIKSGDAIGFAVPSNDLADLMRDPKAISMQAWTTIGALDPEEWKPLMGGSWRQRAGKIYCDAPGDGFGGRTICLHQLSKLKPPFEMQVDVKLEEESGAAGLVFASDGKSKHYGFYPTAGSLRLTRFDGPDVYSWNILETVQSSAYRPGEWNQLHLRYDGKTIRCSVNGVVVIETEDRKVASGAMGLVKFREPNAEFRNFLVGKNVAPPPIDPASQKKIETLMAAYIKESETAAGLIDRFANEGPAAVVALDQEAKRLRTQADNMTRFAKRVRQRNVIQQLSKELASPENDINLARAALLISKLDNPELEIAPYLTRLERIGKRVAERFPDKATPAEKVTILRAVLFDEMSFHGSNADYYDASNSYLNEVLDDREGIPLTLTIVLMEVARHAGFKLEGVGAPGHFIASFGEGKTRRFIDAFEGGSQHNESEMADMNPMVLRFPGSLVPVTKRVIIQRMLNNLIGVAQAEGNDSERLLGYLDAYIALKPEDENRLGMRAMVLAAEGQFQLALDDLDRILAADSTEVDIDLIHQIRARVQNQLDQSR